MTAPVIPETLFDQAIALADERQRSAYLDQACAGDAALRQEAERLVRDHFRAGGFLEQPAVALDVTLRPGSEQIGSQIGPYKLLEQIGEGGMGLVYMAEQQRPVRRLVALKIIKPGMDSKQVIARFEAERQALAMMDHPHIAKVLDAGTTETSRPYFVMELVRGIPINEFCDQKKLTVRQRLELFIQVCHAVQHAHQKGIIHRDLKPTNVLVTLADTVPVPKVIDFGIAKALGQSLTEHTLHTGFAQLVGTPLYMSPEQAEMNQFGVDTRSDVYSLGVMLYELLTGTTPFDKETLTKGGYDEMRRIIREVEPETVSTRLAKKKTHPNAAGNPKSKIQNLKSFAELDWIVARALEKDRTRRYESASSLGADIQRYLSDEPVHACPPSAVYRFRKHARKYRTALTTAALVALALLLGTTISAWQAIRATAAEAQANANESKAKSEEQKALKAAEAENLQRQRAEASELQAKNQLAVSERLRNQAEKNFEAALDAVDRMITQSLTRDINDLPRIGPLRRRLLQDAIAFYERIPLQSELSPEIRDRMAKTWSNIAKQSWYLSEMDQASRAYETAIAIRARLSKEYSRSVEHRDSLAATLRIAGIFYIQGVSNSKAAEHLRWASDLYAELARDNPQDTAWPRAQAQSLWPLAEALSRLGKREEALGCLSRAADLLRTSTAASSFDRGIVLYHTALMQPLDNKAEVDSLFRRAITEFRKYSEEAGNDQPNPGTMYAGYLKEIGLHFAKRYPDEAEHILDDCIDIWRKGCGPTPVQHNWLEALIHALSAQARHLREVAKASPQAENSNAKLMKAETLFQEAITRQRQMVIRFTLSKDRYGLANILQEEAEYQLSSTAATHLPDPAANKLQADALLTEAIQLCRTLAAEFPDNGDYKNRLTDLLKLQAQHFGPKAAADESQQQSTTEQPK